MKNINICKFVTPGQSESIKTSCFVLETDPAVMAITVTLTEHRLLLATQGKGELCIGNSRVPFQPGCLIFAFEGESFRLDCHTPCEYIYINFSGLRSEELFLRFNVRPANRSFVGMDGLIPLWHESLSRASQDTIDLAAESMLLCAFSRLNGSTLYRDSLVGKILEAIDARFTDPAFTIAALAEELGYSPKYLSRVMKTKTGTGFSEYVQNLRLRYAVSLFDHGIDSVKSVALLSGYTDPLYFSTVFKKHVGVSPKDYRARLNLDRQDSSSKQTGR